jgi:hypothetical protein
MLVLLEQKGKMHKIVKKIGVKHESVIKLLFKT